MCVSAVCASLTTSALTVITSVCRMNSQNRQCGALFALMRRFPACMLLNVEIITTGKLPESRVIDCDSFVLNDPCVFAVQACLTSKTWPRCVCWHSWAWRWNSRRSPLTPCNRSCRSERMTSRLLSLTVQAFHLTSVGTVCLRYVWFVTSS